MLGKRRIGLLGGSFNPAHAGHIHISKQAIKRLKLDEVWWLVSPQNPLKSTRGMADYATRWEMAEQLTQSTPQIQLVDIEARLEIYFTIDTIALLQALFPDTHFVWLMGADNLAGFHRWRNWQNIARLLPIAVLDRAPYGMKALKQRFARTFATARIPERDAAQLADRAAPAWTYLSIPRHPLSATLLRKTLGARAFLPHSTAK